MVHITKQSGNNVVYVNEYMVDHKSDIANLPTDCKPGSSAICLEDKNVYFLSGDLKWEVF